MSISIRSLGVIFMELAVFVVFLPSLNYLIINALPFLEGDIMATWMIKLILLGLVMAITLSIPVKDQQIGAAK